jgi:hypothetical protein
MLLIGVELKRPRKSYKILTQGELREGFELHGESVVHKS